jgi:hypothetical protein
MNRMIKLFQQKSNKKFDEYLLAKRKSLTVTVTSIGGGGGGGRILEGGTLREGGISGGGAGDCIPQSSVSVSGSPIYPTMRDVVCAVLKAESDTWAKAAELLRKEELSK